MGLHPIVRPLGLFLAFLGNIQGLTWGVLSLMSVLQYSGARDDCADKATSYSELLGGFICTLFMKKEDEKQRNALVNSSNFYVFSIVCLVFSIIWIGISCFLIYAAMQDKWAVVKNTLIGWMTVASLVSLEDLIVMILLAVDIAKITTSFNIQSNEGSSPPPSTAYVQIFSMHIVMAIVAKGYVLLMVNVAVIIYVVMFMTNDEVKESPMFNKESKPMYVREDRSTHVSIGDHNVQLDYSNASYVQDDELHYRPDNSQYQNPRDEYAMVSEQEMYSSNWSSRSNSFAHVGKASRMPILGQRIAPPRVPSLDYSVSTTRPRSRF